MLKIAPKLIYFFPRIFLDGTLTGTTTRGQNVPESKGNEGVHTKTGTSLPNTV